MLPPRGDDGSAKASWSCELSDTHTPRFLSSYCSDWIKGNEAGVGIV